MNKIIATALLSLSLSFAGCKPTVEGESARYTQSKDRLEALATKTPAMKADITAKIAEFEAAKKEAEAKTGEAKATALRDLNVRIAAYEATLAPATTPDGGAPLGSKLGDAGAAPAADASGGKLGGGSAAGSGSAAAGSGSGSAAPAAGSGSGSAKSGFGGTPPAGSAKSGFGGK